MKRRPKTTIVRTCRVCNKKFQATRGKKTCSGYCRGKLFGMLKTERLIEEFKVWKVIIAAEKPENWDNFSEDVQGKILERCRKYLIKESERYGKQTVNKTKQSSKT